ncbi:MAG: hypothetical protein HC772_13615 [Leptolyngbyaceae cyanobacterium CRU_2_3]|nr:hypothetical protein [Leptolyngbyaceae cyanobacterium CRU_2_3]
MTGIVSPVVNATFGVTCLALSGKVPWTIYGTVWLTWWVSNVSGIFIVTPVLLSWEQLFQKNRPLIQQWLSFSFGSDHWKILRMGGAFSRTQSS